MGFERTAWQSSQNRSGLWFRVGSELLRNPACKYSSNSPFALRSVSIVDLRCWRDLTLQTLGKQNNLSTIELAFFRVSKSLLFYRSQATFAPVSFGMFSCDRNGWSNCDHKLLVKTGKTFACPGCHEFANCCARNRVSNFFHKTSVSRLTGGMAGAPEIPLEQTAVQKRNGDIKRSFFGLTTPVLRALENR